MALLTLIKNFFMLGQPRPATMAMSNFDSWATLVAGILNAAGIEGFLENQNAAYAVDLEAQEWEEFLLAIMEVVYAGGFTAAEVGEIFNAQTWNATQSKNEPSANASLLRASLPVSLQNALDHSKSFPYILGNALRARAGRRFGKSGVHVVNTEQRRHHAVVWQVIVDQVPATEAGRPALADILEE